MVGDQHARHLPILEVVGHLLDIIKKAGRFNEDGLARLFHDEHFIVDGVAGLIGVQPDGAEIVDVHLALGQFDGGVGLLGHGGFLLKNLTDDDVRIGTGRSSLLSVFSIHGPPGSVKYALCCALVTGRKPLAGYRAETFAAPCGPAGPTPVPKNFSKKMRAALSMRRPPGDICCYSA